MQIRYNLANTVDIQRLYKDAEYAKEMGIIVKQQKSEQVKNLENKLREVDNDDENWREKVMGLNLSRPMLDGSAVFEKSCYLIISVAETGRIKW